MNRKKNVAIILAAGQGKRMKSKVSKQYLLIKDKPILYYTIKAFEENAFIDDIILVVEKSQIDYCRSEIVNEYNFKKIKSIVIGGNERYESVYEALKVLSERETSYVLIHDGARPFVDQDIINELLDNAYEYKACVVGVPVKDTIKIVGENNLISKTPDRNTLYMIQTPQVFSYTLIKEAYDKYMMEQPCTVTDDSMVVELMNSCSVKLIEGSYNNIKITTPEDLSIAENILNSI